MLNKKLLRISHFFGFMKDQAHIDDLKLTIPSVYPEKDFDKFGPGGGRTDSQWVVDDIKNQIYNEFKKDLRLEKNCRRMNLIWIHTQDLHL